MHLDDYLNDVSSRPILNALKVATEVRRICDLDEERGMVSAAAFVIRNLCQSTPRTKIVLDPVASKKVILDYVMSLLNNDLFEAAATVLWGPDVYDWRPATSRACWKNLFDHDKLLIQGAGAMGKCEIRGTPILMADGSVKPVEDVRLGDQVMGPDSTPRTVLELHSGVSPTFHVEQERGDAYTVTDDHILTLICTADKMNGDGKTVSSTYTKGRMIDMPIKEYIAKSPQFKEFYKGAFTGVDFPKQEVPMDPYIFGLWLGDGSVKGHSLGLTTPDELIRDAWVNYWESRGHEIRVAVKIGNKASGYFLRAGSIKKHLPFAVGEDGEKVVPNAFRVNDRETRLQVLAGFLDTDGYVYGPGFEFAQKNKDVTDAMVFIARSLGLTATVCKTRKQCVNNGVWGEYYVCKIGGDCTEIPTRLKRALPRRKRACIGRKLTITPAGEQEYFGFALDGDRRFLLGDFTITHNSFSAAAWFYLDWLRDPDWTCIKVISLTREHAERNIFANIKNFHRSALVKPNFISEDKATAIMSTFDSKQGIHLVAIPKGESGHGTLRGFHPSPRGNGVHPRWGKLSRTHVILDEAEEVPSGVWEGVNNILSSADTKANPGGIKIFGASNPKDRTSAFGQRCEPVAGWGSIDCEDDHEWDSKDGYRVLRFDASKCENVIHKKIIFPGLQTYEGYQSYVAKGRTAEADTMARGWFPDEGTAMGIISPSMMDNSMGVVRFIGPVVPLAAFDLALEGNDSVVCSHGRFGLSDGWTDQSGKFHTFKSFRTMLQLDNQLTFPKKATLEQTAAIIEFCKTMKITPNWLCVDRTGNGSGIHDSLVTLFGPEVLGVNYSWAATPTLILGEDSKQASELYNGVVTELLFGVSKYLEFEWLKINPNIRTETLVKQATGRRYKQKGKGTVRVESKADYCKRTRSPSPDALDSLSLLVFLMRQRSGNSATMTEPKAEPISRQKAFNLVEATFNFVDFSE